MKLNTILKVAAQSKLTYQELEQRYPSEVIDTAYDREELAPYLPPEPSPLKKWLPTVTAAGAATAGALPPLFRFLRRGYEGTGNELDQPQEIG